MNALTRSTNYEIVQTAQKKIRRLPVTFDDVATQLQVFLNSFAADPSETRCLLIVNQPKIQVCLASRVSIIDRDNCPPQLRTEQLNDIG